MTLGIVLTTQFHEAFDIVGREKGVHCKGHLAHMQGFTKGMDGPLLTRIECDAGGNVLEQRPDLVQDEQFQVRTFALLPRIQRVTIFVDGIDTHGESSLLAISRFEVHGSPLQWCFLVFFRLHVEVALESQSRGEVAGEDHTAGERSDICASGIRSFGWCHGMI